MAGRLDDALSALARLESPVGWDEVEHRAATDVQESRSMPTPPTRRMRRRPALVLCAAITAILGVIAVTLRADRGTTPVQTSDPTTSSSAPDTSGSSTSTTAPATRTLRTGAVVVTADSRLLVWSGEAGENDVSARADGFSIDVDTGELRPIPPAPIDPRARATGVWTGSELIVCCGTGQVDGYPYDTRSAAAWSPSTGEWRLLTRPPEGVDRSFAASVWTGETMFVIASGGQPAAALYDPGVDEWTDVPAPPLAGRAPYAIWSGDEVIVWDSVPGSGISPPDGALADRGWRWSPGDHDWQPLPDLPQQFRTNLGSMVWTGTHVLVWGESTAQPGQAVGATWRPGDGEWQPLPAWPSGGVSPYEGTEGSQTVQSGPSGWVAVRGLEGTNGEIPPVAVLDSSTNTWHPTSVQIAGYNPTFSIVQGLLVIPDEADPYAGWLPGYGP